MILSDKTIRNYISSGKIKIFPEFNLSDVRPAGIRLHLGSELLIPVNGQKIDLNTDENINLIDIAFLTTVLFCILVTLF